MNVTLQGDQMKFRENPNTALLSAFLMLGTFIIAYYLRIFRYIDNIFTSFFKIRMISRIFLEMVIFLDELCEELWEILVFQLQF